MYSFDITPVIAECRAYINDIDDVEVSLLGEITITNNTTTQCFTRVSLKEHLIEFFFECEEEALKGKLALIQYLKSYGQLWGNTLTEHTRYFDREISATSLEWRIENLEKRKANYQRFHNHKYNLAMLLRYRVMDLPLPVDLRSELESVKSSQAKTAVDDRIDYQPKNDLSNELTNERLLAINNDRQQLYDRLHGYVEDDQKSTLESLILNNLPPDVPIMLTCTQKEFGLTFHQANAVPTNGAKLLSEQLPKYFLRRAGQETHPLKPSILVKHLRGKMG